MNDVMLAKLICRVVHRGQVDKAGEKYYKHPYAIADKLSGREEKILAYLHDAVEDQPQRFSLSKARKLFGEEVAEGLDAITHREGEDYQTYLQRVKANPLAKAVKLCDLHHNMDLSRIKNPTEKDRLRVQNKYMPALKFLNE